MWNRQELKRIGKVRFKNNYWKCVVACLLWIVCIGGIAGGSTHSTNSEYTIYSDIPSHITAMIAAVSIIALLIGIVIRICIQDPLEVGVQRFFVVNTKEKASFSELSYGFTHHYGNIVKTMVLRDIYLFLWTLLFVVPGIIKYYGYRLVPYIMAEHPEMSSKECIACSQSMMQGNKWRAFLLDISFLGWLILSALTGGILYIFYVGPYKTSVNAELYQAIK